MQNATRPARQVLALVVFALAMFAAGMCTMGAINAVQASTTTTVAHEAPACIDSGKGLFNDCAVLDPSQIDDLRTDADKAEELQVAEGGYLIVPDAN